jgi:hypothetical protein
LHSAHKKELGTKQTNAFTTKAYHPFSVCRSSDICNHLDALTISCCGWSMCSFECCGAANGAALAVH